jgi:exonuclease III
MDGKTPTPQKQHTKLILRTVSYNIDGPNMTKDKLSLLLYTIDTQKPDILCLTNVTEQAFNQIHEKLSSGYIAFQVFIEEGESIGTVILCNKGTTVISDEEQPYYFDYPRGGGRIIGTGVVHLNSKLTFNVLTADIDQERESVRSVQLETLTKVLTDVSDYIIMGDVGELEGAFRDVWTKMGCPTKINSEEERLTRTYYDSRVLVPKSMSLIGTKTIKGSQASSHLGLETIFTINKKLRVKM